MEALQGKLSNSSCIKEVLDEDPLLKSQWKLAKQYKNNSNKQENIDQLIQQTIERVKQRQAGIDQARDSKSNKLNAITKIKLQIQPSATSAQSTSIKNVQPIQQTEEEIKSDEEVGSDELSSDDLKFFDEHAPGGENKYLDLQSKIFDQILSMPQHSSSNQVGLIDSSSLLAPCKQQTEQQNGTNLVDNKEILSFNTKPANMSFSMKNENSDRKQVLTKIEPKVGSLLIDSRASKAKNMQNLESNNSIISKNVQKQTPYFVGKPTLIQKKNLGGTRSPVLTHARRSSGQGLTKRPSTYSTNTGVSAASKKTPAISSAAQKFLQATKSTYVSLIDKAEALRQNKSKSRGRPTEASSKRVSGPKISSFKSPNLNTRSRQQNFNRETSKNKTAITNQKSLCSSSTLKMTMSNPKNQMNSTQLPNNLKIPRKVSSKVRILSQKGTQQEDFANIQSTYDTAQQFEEGDRVKINSIQEANTARQLGQTNELSQQQSKDFKPVKQNSSPLFKSRFIKKKEYKVQKAQESNFQYPDLALLQTPNSINHDSNVLNIQKNSEKNQQKLEQMLGRMKSPDAKCRDPSLIQAGTRTVMGNQRRQSRADQKASVKRLYKGDMQSSLTNYLQQNYIMSPKTSILTTQSDAEMEKSARVYQKIAQQTTAANPGLTNQQIKSGFNRKKSGVIERPKSQTQIRNVKSKNRKLFSPTQARKQSKVAEPVKQEPAPQSFIPKSKEYLKNMFETEFWPIVQDLLGAEIDRRLTLVLDGKNLYDNDNNRLTYEQLFVNNFQSTDIEILKLKEVKEQLFKKNHRVMIKTEHVEEVLLRMGFMKNRESVDDMLEFMNLKEQLQSRQQEFKQYYVTQTRLPSNLQTPKVTKTPNQRVSDLITKKEDSLIFSDTNNMDAYILRDSNIESFKDDNSDSEREPKSPQDKKETFYFVGKVTKPFGEISDQKCLQKQSNSNHKITYQIAADEEMTQIGALLYAILNITGIWNSEPKMPRQYQKMRENRDKFFRREVKASIQTLQIEQQASDQKKKVQQFKLEKSKSNGSLSQRQITQKGYFGSSQQHQREYEKQTAKQQEILQNMRVHTSNKTQDFFATSLRSYVPPLKKSPMRGISQKKTSQGKIVILDDITNPSQSTSQYNTKIPVGEHTSFSLKSISKMNDKESKPLTKIKQNVPQLEFQDAVRKFEQKKADIIMTSRSQRHLGTGRSRLDTVRSQCSPRGDRLEKVLDMSMEFNQEEANTMVAGQIHNTVLIMSSPQSPLRQEASMIINSEFERSNFKQSEQYDTCIYNGVANQTFSSQVRTPTRQNDRSTSDRRSINKSQNRGSSYRGATNSYASQANQKRNYMYDQHSRNAGKNQIKSHFHSQRSQSRKNEQKSIEVNSPNPKQTQAPQHKSIYLYNSESKYEASPGSRQTMQVKTYDSSPEQAENNVNITSTFKNLGNDELELSPDFLPRKQSIEQKFSLLISLRQAENQRMSNANNQTFAAIGHSYKNSTDTSFANTPSMSQIPIHELDQKIKDIEEEYNGIVNKELNIRQQQLNTKINDFEAQGRVKTSIIEIQKDDQGIRQSDELLIDDLALINEQQNSVPFSTLEVPVQLQNQEDRENDEDLHRITEEASRLENTYYEILIDSSIVENQQSPQHQYLNSDLLNLYQEDQAEMDKENLRNQLSRSANLTPALSYIGTNEEIKEEFREDSESSNEFISQILNTQNEEHNNSIESLMEAQKNCVDSMSAQEICETRKTQKEKLQMDMISDLRSEAEDFMQKQDSYRTDNKGIRTSKSVENTNRKIQNDVKDNQMEGREFLAGLFKDEEDKIEITNQKNHAVNSWVSNSQKKVAPKKTRKNSPTKARKQWDGKASKPPVAVKPAENKSQVGSDTKSGSAKSSNRKFISKFAKKNLQPIEESKQPFAQNSFEPYNNFNSEIVQFGTSTLSRSRPQVDQILNNSSLIQQQQQSKSRRQGGQPKQNTCQQHRNSNAGFNSSRVGEGQAQQAINTSRNFGSSIQPENTDRDRQNESLLLQLKDELQQADAMHQSSQEVNQRKQSSNEKTRNSHNNSSNHLRSNTISGPGSGNGNDNQDLSLIDFEFENEERNQQPLAFDYKKMNTQLNEPRSATNLNSSRRSIQLAAEAREGLNQKNIDSSENSSMIFKIPKSDKSMFKNVTSQYGASESGSREQQTEQTVYTEPFDMEQNIEEPKRVIKFEIFVDETIGTQLIEIHDRKHIAEHVERFALRFEIRSRTKINKLKKYIKSQFKQENGALLL